MYTRIYSSNLGCKYNSARSQISTSAPTPTFSDKFFDKIKQYNSARSHVLTSAQTPTFSDNFFYQIKQCSTKEEARLDRTFSPVEVEKSFFSTKDKTQQTCCNYAEFNEGTLILYRR